MRKRKQMSLDELRKNIDRCDADIVRLLNERTEHVLEIGRLKEQTGDGVYVPSREKAVLERATNLNDGPLPDTAIGAIYREIMSASLALEHPIKIAYLGPQATFTHQAAREKFGASVAYVEAQTIRDVFKMIENNQADYGVVPIENSTEGAVTHTLDEFTSTTVKICAEVYLDISHNLMANCAQADITKIYSNPQVFGQCRNWLHDNMPSVDLIPVSSTARAAEMASKEPRAGAMASALAAELYGLQLLHADVQDISGNETRFLVIAKYCGESTGNDKTSLLFTVNHKAGALHGALNAFSSNGINMCKIESRPSKGKAWEYMFFVDIEGHTGDENVAAALEELQKHCSTLTVMGSYPNGSAED